MLSLCILSVGCSSQKHNVQAAKDNGDLSSREKRLKIAVGNRSVEISPLEWEVLKSEFEYSVNLKNNRMLSNEKYNQIVTVFNLEMTRDRKSGTKLSDNIYLESFRTLQDSVTVQIRIDKGSYWILSRQTFSFDNDRILSIGEYADEKKSLLISNMFKNEISNTIYTLNRHF
jgi:hypothetical protein